MIEPCSMWRVTSRTRYTVRRRRRCGQPVGRPAGYWISFLRKNGELIFVCRYIYYPTSVVCFEFESNKLTTIWALYILLWKKKRVVLDVRSRMKFNFSAWMALRRGICEGLMPMETFSQSSFAEKENVRLEILGLSLISWKKKKKKTGKLCMVKFILHNFHDV